MTDTLAKFKEKNTAYQSTQFKIETFNDYEDYTLALTSAFAQGKGPDVYEINNSEKN
jgi:ABC-type glycerol-3-phosphate transport system substrate-binding protein